MLHATAIPLLLFCNASFFPPPQDHSPIEHLPGGCQIVIDAPGLGALLEGGLDQPWIQRLRSFPGVAAALENANMSPEAAVGLASAFLGRPLFPALAELCEDGLALGLRVEGGEPQPYLALRSADADELEWLVEHLLTQTERAQDLPRGSLLDAGRSHPGYPGTRVWKLGEELAFALRGPLLLASKTRFDVDAMLNAPGSGVINGESWKREVRAFDERSDARLWVDVEGLEAALGPDSTADLRRLGNDPGVHFVLGSEIARLSGMKRACFELFADRDTARLQFHSFGGAQIQIPALHPGDLPAPPLPTARDTELLRGHLYRNFDALFEHRQDLFGVEAQPKFAEAAANLSLFLGGADVEEDIFPHLSPWFGLIAREVEMRPKPDLLLPAVCLVAYLDEPEILGPRLVAGFQTAIGFVNIDAAQEREPSMVLSLEQHQGIPISLARYLAPPEGEGVDARFNLVPACALVGDTFVLGTHVSLVREVAAQLQAGDVGPAQQAIDRLEVDGAALHRTFAANVDGLVLNAVLSEGKAPAVARRKVDALLTLTKLIERAEATLTDPAAGRVGLELSLELLPWKKK